MKFDSYGRPAGRPNRRSIRLKGYDYSQAGAYFITIVTQDRACLFGDGVGGEIRLNGLGEIVRQEWLRTGHIRPNVELDAFVVMPNHVHGIIVLHGDGRGTLQRAPTTVERFGKPTSNTIPTIVRLFKSATTKRINERRGTPGAPIWQRNYYEHIIRDDESLNRIRQYIAENPLRWHLDRENPYIAGARGRAPLPKDEPWLA
ncbi:MAG: hypothetical protein NNA22_12480 [Nitrospira sp.]|nr:hypothetical protein [Nitrospira sp.]